MTTKTVETKTGKTWKTTYETSNEKEALHSLASDLAARFIGKALYVKRIARRNNYDGTQTYVVTYCNDCRATYVTDIY